MAGSGAEELMLWLKSLLTPDLSHQAEKGGRTGGKTQC